MGIKFVCDYAEKVVGVEGGQCITPCWVSQFRFHVTTVGDTIERCDGLEEYTAVEAKKVPELPPLEPRTDLIWREGAMEL